MKRAKEKVKLMTRVEEKVNMRMRAQTTSPRTLSAVKSPNLQVKTATKYSIN